MSDSESWREQLFQGLLDRSFWVYERISLGALVGVELHEETITQEILLDLRVQFPDLVVKTFSRRTEARTGADWEWWWEGKARWFGARVQAKRLKVLRRDVTGYEIRYTGSAQPASLQVDRLLASAAAAGLPAIYVLYNGPRLDLTASSWRCPNLIPAERLMGVGFVAAETIAWLARLGRDEQEAVNSFAAPWCCLCLCDDDCRTWPILSDEPSDYGFPADTDTADLAYVAARAVVFSQLAPRIGQLRAHPDAHPRWELFEAVRMEPPAYVQTALSDSVTPDEGLDLPTDVDHLVVVPQIPGPRLEPPQ